MKAQTPIASSGHARDAPGPNDRICTRPAQRRAGLGIVLPRIAGITGSADWLYPNWGEASSPRQRFCRQPITSNQLCMAYGEHIWRTPPASPFGHHDLADFAQEFLRRNPVYCQAAQSARLQVGLSAGGARQRLARSWGLCRLIDPGASPRACPALWQPACHPAIVQIRCSPRDLGAVCPGGYTSLAEHRDGDAYHLVLGCSLQRLRLCLWLASEDDRPVLNLAKDKDLAIRLSAATCYAAAWRKHKVAPKVPFQPSPYQRAALVRLLQICDALAAGASCPDIAWSIVFPRHERLTGNEWKGSAERRHCWRLIGQARRLTNGGHLQLLSLSRGSRQA